MHAACAHLQHGLALRPADLPPGLSERIDATGLPATHGAALPTQSPSDVKTLTRSGVVRCRDRMMALRGCADPIRTFGSSRQDPQDSSVRAYG